MTTTTWQPMSEQPPKSFTYGDVAVLVNRAGLYAIGRSRLHPEGAGVWPEGEGLTPPHRVGERVAVREEWAVSETYDAISDDRCAEWLPGCSVAYKADDPTTLIAWRPAWAMPSWAIRTYRTCTSSRPMRACDVTEEQAEAMGYRPYKQLDALKPGEIVGPDGMTPREAFLYHCGPDTLIWGWLETFVDEAAK